MSEPKILFWDLETSLQPVAVFQLANNDWIQPDNILSERYIICGSWKLQNEAKTHSVSVLDDLKRYRKSPHDDRFVCEELHKALSACDVAVAHNGDSFDMKYIKTRMLFHGLPPLPPITTIDTYKVAKSKFMFNSNKLDYISGFLGMGHKIRTSPKLWLRILAGDEQAILEMVKYNKKDVELLEKVFDKLVPYVDNHINRELFGEAGCPRCGSNKVQSRGFHRAISRTYRRFCCNSCHGWYRSVVNEKDIKPKSRVL